MAHNTLVDDNINLVYHGMRATDPAFQVDIERKFDSEIGEIHSSYRCMEKLTSTMTKRVKEKRMQKKEERKKKDRKKKIVHSVFPEEFYPLK